jgi:bile acid:Na+ symporter, BASS family
MNGEVLLTLAIKASIVLTVFALGLRASPREATSLLRDPKRLIKSLVCMNVIMPTLTALLVIAFDIMPAVKIALLALAISPVPPIWPGKTMKAGGSEVYTIGLLVASAALAIVIIPVSLEILELVFRTPLRMTSFAITELVLGTVLLPLVAGIATRAIAPQLAREAARPMVQLATVILAIAVVLVLLRVWPVMMRLVGDGTLAVMVCFVVLGLAFGRLFGGPGEDDRVVLSLATAVRHPGIAIAIARANFPTQRLAPAAILLYVLVSAVMTFAYVRWTKRRAARHTALHPSVARLARR